LGGGEKIEDKAIKVDPGKKVDAIKFGDFIDVICYNCGTLGHHKANCKKPNICFTCKKENHVTGGCPIRKEGHKCASYIVSAASGLGFYHIELPEGGGNETMDFSNCGLSILKQGILSKRNCSWNWQHPSILNGLGR
jgi:hypothetical protein